MKRTVNTRNVRTQLTLVLLIGTMGMGTELVLLEHFDSPWQWIPIALLGTGALSAGLGLLLVGPWVVRTHRIVMGMLILAGGVGQYLHYSGNVEFELEMYPSRHGAQLVWESLKGATPTMAPGAMILLGLVGLVATGAKDMRNGKGEEHDDPV